MLKEAKNDIEHLYKELAAKNKELQELNQAKSDFVSIVSHELRTPLSIVRESISSVLDKLVGELNEEQERILTCTINNIDRLTRMVNDLLDVSRLEAGRMELNRDLVNINDLVQHVASSFRQKAESKGLDLFVDIPGEALNIYADSVKVEQIIINLVGNALKFTEEGSVIVSVRKKGDMIECSVSDTGIGIPQEDLPKIFNKFEHMGYRVSKGEKSTGLGLSIAKGIVEMHGGKIWAESKLNEGAKFTFTLPLYTAELLLKDHVDQGIREAVEKESKVSLIAVSPSINAQLPNKKVSLITKEIEGVLKRNLRRAGDAAFVSPGVMAVVLADCDKKGALEVGSRLEHALQGYLVSKKLNEKVALKLGSVTYPDDAGSGEELMKRARLLWRREFS